MYLIVCDIPIQEEVVYELIKSHLQQRTTRIQLRFPGPVPNHGSSLDEEERIIGCISGSPSLKAHSRRYARSRVFIALLTLRENWIGEGHADDMSAELGVSARADICYRNKFCSFILTVRSPTEGPRLTAVGIRCADHATPSLPAKIWH
jgi:hypothetical protein